MFDESFIYQFAASDWFGFHTSQHRPQHVKLVENSGEEEYVKEEQDEIESDEDEDERESTFVSYETFVEFDVWIYRDGKFRIPLCKLTCKGLQKA